MTIGQEREDSPVSASLALMTLYAGRPILRAFRWPPDPVLILDGEGWRKGKELGEGLVYGPMREWCIVQYMVIKRI